MKLPVFDPEVPGGGGDAGPMICSGKSAARAMVVLHRHRDKLSKQVGQLVVVRW
jgi:hypothetical protein